MVGYSAGVSDSAPAPAVSACFAMARVRFRIFVSSSAMLVFCSVVNDGRLLTISTDAKTASSCSLAAVSLSASERPTVEVLRNSVARFCIHSTVSAIMPPSFAISAATARMIFFACAFSDDPAGALARFPVSGVSVAVSVVASLVGALVSVWSFFDIVFRFLF